MASAKKGVDYWGQTHLSDVDDNEYDDEVDDDELSQIGSAEGESKDDHTTEIQIAQTETKAVQRSKILVYISLFLFAFATSAITWYYVRADEVSDIEYEFNVFARDLLEGADDRALTIIRQLQTLSTSITSFALKTEATWPYVTLPNFYARTKQLGTLSNSEMILFAPIVDRNDLNEWNTFVQNNQETILADTFEATDENTTMPLQIHQILPNKTYQSNDITMQSMDIAMPLLQYGPNARSTSLLNMDLTTHPVLQQSVSDSMSISHSILRDIADISFLAMTDNDSTHASPEEPLTVIAQPVYKTFETNSSEIVGFVLALEPWSVYLQNTLPEEVDGFLVYTDDTCGVAKYAWTLHGGTNVEFRGASTGLEDRKFDILIQQAQFATSSRYDGADNGQLHCEYSLTVYPSDDFERNYNTTRPHAYAAVVFGVFLCTVSVFCIYDWSVQRRQRKVLGAAQRTTRLIKSLFPNRVGDRILQEAEEKAAAETAQRNKGTKNKLAAFMSSNADRKETFETDPIAEFFTDTTIMFADIVGFTAWSSTRQPKDVFSLLETIYADFDDTARRRRVFKVETVGDCYVAVAGLPEPRADHAVVMCRFARDCMYRFETLTSQLEVSLGPDTTDLAIRVGLHSGPVTAGVLRGERARFQLFGDTMNTASRMESTGQPRKIQLSQDTADMLRFANKMHWVRKREEVVEAKGKGKMQTYWLDLKQGSGPRSGTATTADMSESETYNSLSTRSLLSSSLSNNRLTAPQPLDEKEQRLVRWNVDILAKALREVVARRPMAAPDQERKVRLLEKKLVDQQQKTVLDEVEEIIRLPEFEPRSDFLQGVTHHVELNRAVKDQLHSYVQSTAMLYRDSNPFHNFEHASHVAMSTVKLMSRIVAPDLDGDEVGKTLHDHTYGITSDPMTQFACVFSSLIHDCDHTGVPNTQLVKERLPLALAYNNKSVAEQNSVDLAWSLLMEDRYIDLRKAIYTTEEEFKRFRQLVVNAVMSTDIMDKDLGQQRRNRWARAFSESALSVEAGMATSDAVNRKATIVIEYLIQASDVSHTMQHFQVYQKWNGRLFREMFKAYKEGRAEKDPSEFWYKGELGFFELYIIPLAKKLKDCGVFGVSSDEYLDYALHNQKEWEARGHQIVAELREAALSEYHNDVEDEEEESDEEDFIEEVSAAMH